MAGNDQGQGMQPPRGDGTPQPGEIIAGKYQVERVLGRGGMGVVVAAWHPALRQRVAVKLLLPAVGALPEASDRFLREAQSAGAIKSEHVARVLDVGTLETGAPYIIMEHLTGTDMSALIKSRGTLPIEEAIDYVLQACEAIAEAHSLGIVHRDLKPANLFLTARADGSPLVKVLDFGLSKVSAALGSEASLTATSAVLGSPHYMSPEQMRSLKHVDARTDIWSLGVILYQLLTGRRPFDGESLPAIFGAIAVDQPLPLRSHRSEIPELLEKAVLLCLEKDQGSRVQTVAELARALGPFGGESAETSVQRITRVLGGGTGDAIPRASKASVPTISDSTTAAVAWGQTKAPSRNHLVVAVLAGAAALALAVLMAIALVFRGQPATELQRASAAIGTGVNAAPFGDAPLGGGNTIAAPVPSLGVSAVKPSPLSPASSKKPGDRRPGVKAPALVKDRMDQWD